MLDFTCALIALVVLSPILVVVAICVRIKLGSPVLFTQDRPGRNEKIFKLYKFRSMTVDNDVLNFKSENKLTKIGKFIRKTSIDELPQLINLLNGTMSLIGYRPSQKSEDELNTAREGFNLYQIRPGISGWAQVNGRDVLAAHPT